MSRKPFDPRKALAVLARHRVRYVLIGGIAANAHGSPSATFDLDICYAGDDLNLRRLAEALTELRARLRGAPEELPFVLDAKTLKMGDHFTFATEAGDFDCLKNPAGIQGFGPLAERAKRYKIAGHTVRVASIDDLIAMKRAAGRPKDLIEIEVLAALREEISNLGRKRRKT
jgi:hypothetical protein